MKPWSRLLLVVPLFLVPAVVRAQVAPDKALSTFTVHADGLELSLWASEEGAASSTRPASTSTTRAASGSASRSTTATRSTASRRAGQRATASSSWKTPRATGKADKCHRLLPGAGHPGPARHRRRQGPGRPRLQGLRLPVARHPRLRGQERRRQGGRPAEEAAHRLRRHRPRPRRPRHPHRPRRQALFQRRRPRRPRPAKRPTARAASGPATSTDCRAGTIWRCDLDGKNLELIAHNFRNEYEPCVDSFGTVFVSDNDDDGNQQTRICYVMPGGNYGYHHAARRSDHWHEEQPGIVPKILRTYFGVADRHVRLRGHAAAEEVLGPAAAHRRRPAPGPLLPPDSRTGPATTWTARTW